MSDPFVKGCYHHLFNRGWNKRKIFFSGANYVYLLRKIKSSVPKYGVGLIAYCLMPNHYHFLVRQETDRPLSDWIQYLFNSYVQAVNKQLGSSGTLFQGRTKHILVDNDVYLIHLVRYIHYNPTAAKLTRQPEEWQYSNYLEWINQRHGTLVDRDFIRRYFEKIDVYQTFVVEYSIEKDLAEKLEKYYLE